MKTVFVLFDSLNRLSLEAYGGQVIRTPNFCRLAERTTVFDRHYVGSLPCMPARRDLMTGRLNFLHRSWGPLEPYDNAFPELLRKSGTYTHLITDHYHYWEDGGGTYHNRFDTFEFIRGQECDPWKAMVQPPWERLRQMYHQQQYSEARRNKFYHYMVNREFIRDDKDFPSVQCFDAGLAFLDRNRTADNWFLQLETFDPHEPFYAPKRFRDAYKTDYAGPVLDWPPYARVTEAPEECAELRANYCAVVALCDEQLGRVLDYFDQHDLWRDTALVVGTDHGFLLGEHDWWAKNRMPVYDEIAHIPLFIHHPDITPGTRRGALTQTIDLMPTFLGLHGVALPAEVQGKSLLPVLERDQTLREAALFGVFGSAVNVTDGRYTYFRYPDDLAWKDLYQYTLMPTHMTAMFSPDELAGATLAPSFPFSKGAPLLKVPATEKSPLHRSHGPAALADTETVLFDLQSDPRQLYPLDDAAVAARLAASIAALMAASHAPEEMYRRFNLPRPA